MTLLQAYLQSPNARRTLSKRPGDKGFSLIELVVVVAILAILAAVALPNFLGVSKDGQIAAAKNTLATIIKECSVKEVRTGGDNFGQAGSIGADAPIQAAGAKLNGYDLVFLKTVNDNAKTAVATDKIVLAATGNTGKANKCYRVAALPSQAGSLPAFAVNFNPADGSTTKSCVSVTGTTYINGCLKLGTSTTQPADGVVGEW